MSTTTSIANSNKENELDDLVCNKLPIRKGVTRAVGGSRKSFGKFLDNAMNEIREETDLKVAMKYQSFESDSYIGKKCSDEKMLQSGEYG